MFNIDPDPVFVAAPLLLVSCYIQDNISAITWADNVAAHSPSDVPGLCYVAANANTAFPSAVTWWNVGRVKVNRKGGRVCLCEFRPHVAWCDLHIAAVNPHTHSRKYSEVVLSAQPSLQDSVTSVLALNSSSAPSGPDIYCSRWNSCALTLESSPKPRPPC